MCGRFVSTNSPEEIANYFSASFEEPLDSIAIPANYNVAPTDDVHAVVATGDDRAVRALRWGLVPVWAKDVKIGSSMINARAETVADKPAFKRVFIKYRCIIPMDGYYEWQAARPDGPIGAKGKPVKQPMYVHRPDGEPLAVAGLWSVWRDRNGTPDAPWLRSCTVITTTANETMAPVHDRMPVMLPAAAWEQWLDPANSDVDKLRELLVPAPESLLTMHAVSTQVNDVRNNGGDLILPLDPVSGVGQGGQRLLFGAER